MFWRGAGAAGEQPVANPGPGVAPRAAGRGTRRRSIAAGTFDTGGWRSAPACRIVKLIVGLGNPGDEYRGTRHNVGFEVVDETASRWALTFRSAPADALLANAPPVPGSRGPVLLAKPLTYMNRSGFAVGALLRY